jgi:hypothetical protein
MAKSKGKIFRIYKRLKFRKVILGITTLVFTIKCDICLTNLQKNKRFSIKLFDIYEKSMYNVSRKRETTKWLPREILKNKPFTCQSRMVYFFIVAYLI